GSATDWTDVTTGLASACGLRNGGQLFCWGYGGGGAGGSPSAPLFPLAGVSKGASHMTSPCALRDGALVCWGSNTFGPLGEGTTNEHSVPVPVTGFDDWIGFRAGYSTCAVRENGDVYCWGLDYELAPTLVPDVARAVRVTT